MRTKKYFGTDGIRGRVGKAIINPEFILKLGWAVGKVLNEKFGEAKVLIGKDTRISGYLLESVLEAGLSSAGVNSWMLGPVPTPAVAYLTRAFRAQAGIEISASHNPYYDNGIKFFSSKGTKLSNEIENAIEEKILQPMKLVDVAKLGKVRRVDDAPGRYVEFCKSTMSMRDSLKGIKIVVDCANGATYHIAPMVLNELGASVVKVGVEPDGFNINNCCGSTCPKTLVEAVLSKRADLGMAFDGDGDRVIMVDHKGEIVDGDELLFIIAKHQFSVNKLQGGVISTVMSNLGLENGLNKLGIDFKRTLVGDRYVIDALYKNHWLLGGEPSGHIAHLGITTTGDGIISALQVLNVVCCRGTSLSDLKSEMTKYPQVLINVNCKNPKSFNNDPKMNEEVTKMTKVLGKKGRILLRPSGTEPVIRIMVEGEDTDLITKVAEDLAEVVRKVVGS
ncbi:MAG: phosphoglucosamine mutase [Coxiellaceae bacterium]|jgi:phosphoglucosamine mutase|nr:phosphoglucosamine mutase [Coxiellaceae bacterium]